MSLPSDVNPDVDEAARAMDAKRRERPAASGLDRRVAPEHYGIAAAILVAFLGVALVGPRVREWRRPRRARLADRFAKQARKAADRARRRADDMRGEAGRRLRRLGGGSIWPR